MRLAPTRREGGAPPPTPSLPPPLQDPFSALSPMFADLEPSTVSLEPAPLILLHVERLTKNRLTLPLEVVKLLGTTPEDRL